MKAEDVIPQKWNHEDYPIRVLYDDGDYSIIWGRYEKNRALGVRWNGEDTGYPGQGAYPTWYVEPDFIAISILQRILLLAIDDKDETYLDNIHFAIQELSDKMTNE
jgi:hypothetical protein